MQLVSPIVLALLLWVAIIALFDWRRRRVPNVALVLVLVPATLALLLQRQGLLGEHGFSSLMGAGLGFALTFPGYQLRRFGAGDVKFAAVLGLLLGTLRGLEMVLWASLLMGVMADATWLLKRSRDAKFPAAPALAAAFAIEMLGGPVLLR